MIAKVCAAGLLSFAGVAGAQTQALPLVDGSQVTVQGRLAIEHRGWSTYLVIKTAAPYRAMFDPNESTPKIVHEIGLTLTWQGEALAAEAGKSVTAGGKVQLEPVSPYYWNGALLVADRVSLADGRVLKPMADPVVPGGVKRYLATVTFVPGKFSRMRSAVDLGTNAPLPDARVDGCSLNGGGDVLNCSCVDGFAPTQSGVVPRALTVGEITQLRKANLISADMAQLGIPEDATHPFTVQVVCARKKVETR